METVIVEEWKSPEYFLAACLNSTEIESGELKFRESKNMKMKTPVSTCDYFKTKLGHVYGVSILLGTNIQDTKSRILLTEQVDSVLLGISNSLPPGMIALTNVPRTRSSAHAKDLSSQEIQNWLVLVSKISIAQILPAPAVFCTSDIICLGEVTAGDTWPDLPPEDIHSDYTMLDDIHQAATSDSFTSDFNNSLDPIIFATGQGSITFGVEDSRMVLGIIVDDWSAVAEAASRHARKYFPAIPKDNLRVFYRKVILDDEIIDPVVAVVRVDLLMPLLKCLKGAAQFTKSRVEVGQGKLFFVYFVASKRLVEGVLGKVTTTDEEEETEKTITALSTIIGEVAARDVKEIIWNDCDPTISYEFVSRYVVTFEIKLPSSWGASFIPPGQFANYLNPAGSDFYHSHFTLPLSDAPSPTVSSMSLAPTPYLTTPTRSVGNRNWSVASKIVEVHHHLAPDLASEQDYPSLPRRKTQAQARQVILEPPMTRKAKAVDNDSVEGIVRVRDTVGAAPITDERLRMMTSPMTSMQMWLRLKVLWGGASRTGCIHALTECMENVLIRVGDDSLLPSLTEYVSGRVVRFNHIVNDETSSTVAELSLSRKLAFPVLIVSTWPLRDLTRRLCNQLRFRGKLGGLSCIFFCSLDEAPSVEDFRSYVAGCVADCDIIDLVLKFTPSLLHPVPSVCALKLFRISIASLSSHPTDTTDSSWAVIGGSRVVKTKIFKDCMRLLEDRSIEDTLVLGKKFSGVGATTLLRLISHTFRDSPSVVCLYWDSDQISDLGDQAFEDDMKLFSDKSVVYIIVDDDVSDVAFGHLDYTLKLYRKSSSAILSLRIRLIRVVACATSRRCNILISPYLDDSDIARYAAMLGSEGEFPHNKEALKNLVEYVRGKAPTNPNRHIFVMHLTARGPKRPFQAVEKFLGEKKKLLSGNANLLKCADILAGISMYCRDSQNLPVNPFDSDLKKVVGEGALHPIIDLVHVDEYSGRISFLHSFLAFLWLFPDGNKPTKSVLMQLWGDISSVYFELDGRTMHAIVVSMLATCRPLGYSFSKFVSYFHSNKWTAELCELLRSPLVSLIMPGLNWMVLSRHCRYCSDLPNSLKYETMARDELKGDSKYSYLAGNHEMTALAAPGCHDRKRRVARGLYV